MEVKREKLEEMKKEMEQQRLQGMAMFNQAIGATLAVDHLLAELDKEPQEGYDDPQGA